jgi:hypothetical protein
MYERDSVLLLWCQLGLNKKCPVTSNIFLEFVDSHDIYNDDARCRFTWPVYNLMVSLNVMDSRR